jgi:hypothetical protein
MENPMGQSVTNLLTGLAGAWMLVLFSLTASAELETDPSCERIEQLLVMGSSPHDVLAAVVNDGMSLVEATVFAMVCGGQENRIDIVTAGVEMADSLAEARSVVAAVVAATGDSSAESAAARAALDTYEKTARQPDVYESDYIPHGGGGVSPST